MDSDNQVVSVILPIYNAGRYLDQALASVEEQTYDAIEIICVNDGSTDDSLTIMRAHANHDARIRVINQPNRGYGAAMNRGIAEATGTWIAILEPDDWIEPDAYSEMIACARNFVSSDTPIDVIKTPYWVIRNPDTPDEVKLNCSYRHRVRPRRQPFQIHDAPHLLGHHPSIWSALYRRSFLDDFSIRFREIPGAGWADNPFLVETLCQARSIVYLDKPFYCYREETPEKEIALSKRSPLLPFERWQDMADILDRLHVTDPVVWTQQITRGFTYMGGIIQNTGLEHRPELQAAVHRMFDRMDPNLVFKNPRVTPAAKRLFAEYRGIEHPSLGRLNHLRYLAAEALYNIRNKGPRQTLRMIAKFVTTYGRRTGN